MAYTNSQDWDALAPYWVNLVEGSATDEKRFIYDYGTRLTSDNGNNGHNCAGKVKGSVRGEFKIQFNLGYTWGFSRFIIGPISQFNGTTLAGGNFNGGTGTNGLQFMNNNSNNKLIIYTVTNGNSVTTETSPGYAANTLYTVWRDASNVVKYKIGSSSVVTAGTFNDHFVFWSEAQSPCSCTLLAAQSLKVADS